MDSRIWIGGIRDIHGLRLEKRMCNVHETTVMTTWLQLDGIQPGTFEGRIRVYSS